MVRCLSRRADEQRAAGDLSRGGQRPDRRRLSVADRLGHRSAEFSIQIGEAEARGQGFGAAATRAALAHAFDDLNLHRVWLTLLASNTRAEALYKKVGFQREGVLRDAAFKAGRYVDVVTMAILDSRRG